MAEKMKNESMRIVPPGKKKCVWMEAGVVSYKLCDNNYDCPTCVYDHGMQLKVARQKEATAASQVTTAADNLSRTWVDQMMLMPASRRKCRYMLTGEVGRKICPNAYECGTCSFDRMMQSRLKTESNPVPNRTNVAGFEMAEGFYYNEGHVWARPEYGGRVRIGLDDFAQKLLGRLSSVETPDIGHELAKDKPGFRLKRNGASVDALSPVDGIVTHINQRLVDHPELINESPYKDGWLFIVEPTHLRKNLKGLLFGEEAAQYMADEKEKLFAEADENMRLAADGGDTVEDVFEELGADAWSNLAKKFLKTSK